MKSRRKTARDKIARRVIYGALLAVAAVYFLVRELDLDVDVLFDYLLASALLVTIVIVLALLMAALLRLLRRNK